MLRINRLSKQTNGRLSLTEGNPEGEKHTVVGSHVHVAMPSVGHRSIEVSQRCKDTKLRSQGVCKKKLLDSELGRHIDIHSETLLL